MRCSTPRTSNPLRFDRTFFGRQLRFARQPFGLVCHTTSDLLALFATLEYPAVVERLYKESEGDMRRPTVFSSLAEEFGIGLEGTGTPYLRSALNGPNYQDAPIEEHIRSTVWTGAIYEIVVQMVEASGDSQVRVTNFESFKQSVIDSSQWVKGMLIRALHCIPPTGVTMPVLARIIYAVDERLFPTDSRFRDIAKNVFQQRGLWHEDISLEPPGIGPTFQDFDKLPPTEQIRMIKQNAEALRIPHGSCPLQTPRLTTVTRQVDPTLMGKMNMNQSAVTERYLQFAYEWVEPIPLSGDTVGIGLYFGGTLVLDENWNDLMLITDPVTFTPDLNAPEPAIAALARATDRFNQLHRTAIRTLRIQRNSEAVESLYSRFCCPFTLKRTGSGPFRFARRTCNLNEHFKGISKIGSGFSIAKRLGLHSQ